MPKTKSGRKVMKKMKEQYGKEKGEDIYFAMVVKGKSGTSKWEKLEKGSTLKKARKTYSKKHNLIHPVLFGYLYSINSIFKPGAIP